MTKQMIKHVVLTIIQCEGVIRIPHDESIYTKQKEETIAQALMKSLQSLGASECRLTGQTVAFKGPDPPPAFRSYESPFIYVWSGEMSVHVGPEAIFIKYRVYPHRHVLEAMAFHFAIWFGATIIAKVFVGMQVNVIDLFILISFFFFGTANIAAIHAFTRIIKNIVRDIVSSCEI